MKYGLVIHGGAGTILPSAMTPELEKEYKFCLQKSLDEAYQSLEMGSNATDAVCIAIQVMEDSPLFNAGRGSVYTHDGTHDMDASIMRGDDLEAGAISGSKTVRNPILLAKAILLHSSHVYLTGTGAEDFAREHNLKFEDETFFHTEFRYRQYQHALQTDEVFLDHSDQKKFGTVGCVALDKFGNICAGTSTGGMTNKKYGRVGDSALIGAGTYANNKTCAVSCTGDGEYFIRAVSAYEMSALMEYKGLNIKEAGQELIHKKMVDIGGEGGLIAMDCNGNYCLPFNSAGMYRGVKMSDEKAKVGFYKDWL
tara:strand:- start:1036 stop:1965 length:930 start_codon:yes stop_codon:yes gene_type:complete